MTRTLTQARVNPLLVGMGQSFSVARAARGRGGMALRSASLAAPLDRITTDPSARDKECAT
jgi:hypothetical protein